MPAHHPASLTSPLRRANPSFAVKRKQVNYSTLETSSSLASLLYKEDPKTSQLQADLKQAIKDANAWRHRCLLMENERDKFESAVRAQCDRDMQYLRCEIDALKEAHLQKVQSMADTIAHLQDTTESLRHQLRQHNITEEPTARSDEFHTRSLDTDDVEFFKKAYYHAKRLDQDEYLNNERWMTLQSIAISLEREIETFQTWRSLAAVPVAELTRLVQEANDLVSTSHGNTTSLRKAFFGRKGSGRKKS